MSDSSVPIKIFLTQAPLRLLLKVNDEGIFVAVLGGLDAPIEQSFAFTYIGKKLGDTTGKVWDEEGYDGALSLGEKERRMTNIPAVRRMSEGKLEILLRVKSGTSSGATPSPPR